MKRLNYFLGSTTSLTTNFLTMTQYPCIQNFCLGMSILTCNHTVSKYKKLENHPQTFQKITNL